LFCSDFWARVGRAFERSTVVLDFAKHGVGEVACDDMLEALAFVGTSLRSVVTWSCELAALWLRRTLVLRESRIAAAR